MTDGRLIRMLVCIIGLLAWITAAVSSIFTILDAYVLADGHASISGLPIAATVLSLINLISLTFFLVFLFWRQSHSSAEWRRTQCGLVVAGSIMSTIAVFLTLAYLVVVRERSSRINRTIAGDWIHQYAAKLTMWALTAVAQCAFFILLFLTRPSAPSSSKFSSPPRSRETTAEEMHRSPIPLTIQTASPAYPHASPFLSPTHSTSSFNSGRSSWRSSIQQAVRPVSSKTKLVMRHTPMRPDSKMSNTSLDATSPHDAFDMWDTSEVDPHARDAVLQSAPSRGTALEPIPGSRPASPAKVLDNFPMPPSVAEASNTPTRGRSPTITRPESPFGDQAHIHPLFRSDSPVPPPVVSPGTVLIASPVAGQTVPRPPSRMRSSSSVAASSPLATHGQWPRSRAGSRAASMRSVSPHHTAPALPVAISALSSSPPDENDDIGVRTTFHESDSDD